MKRAFALLMILIMSLAPAGSVFARRGALSPAFSGGSGTAEDPYAISGAEELLSLAALTASGETCEGLYFILTADIDAGGIDWEPIGSGLACGDGSPAVFSGHFSGGGHRIGGITVGGEARPFAGLFGRTEGGSITDIKVIGACVSGEANVGGIVGSANGTAIERVRFEGEVTGARSAGGIIGGGDGASISDSAADAVIEAEQYAGGVCGIAGGMQFTRCTASGTVSGTKEIGGIAGYCFDSVFYACQSRAQINGGDHVSGIAGKAQTSSFTLCENLGAVSAERFAGGVSGFCMGCEFISCANRAAISGDTYIGGLIGWSDDGADFGDNGLDNVLTACMNTGAVSGKWGAGGIIGDSHDAAVSDCFNTGAVTSIEYAGGLTGYTAESRFTRCYSTGSVSSGSFGNALVGKIAYSGADFSDCCYLDSCCAGGDAHGLPRSEYELLSPAAYPGFDFGAVWAILPEGYPFARLLSVPAPIPLYGDTDGDGEVCSADALLALRCAMELGPLSPLEAFRADMNCNGLIESIDALAILRRALGLE